MKPFLLSIFLFSSLIGLGQSVDTHSIKIDTIETHSFYSWGEDSLFRDPPPYENYHFLFSEFEGVILTNSFLRDSKFTPSVSDIIELESKLDKGLQKIKKRQGWTEEVELIRKKLNSYTRQYEGFIDKRGRKIIYVNFITEDGMFTEDWLTKWVSVFDGGNEFWVIYYNVDSGKFFDLSINGYS